MRYLYLDRKFNKRDLTERALRQQIKAWGVGRSFSTFTGGIPVVESGFLHTIFVAGCRYSIDETLEDHLGRDIDAFYHMKETGEMAVLDDKKALELVDRYGLDFFSHVYIKSEQEFVSIEGKLQEIIGRKKRYWRREEQ